LSDLPETIKTAIKNTANKLSGARRRGFIAEVTLELLAGNARKAEREFGWGRQTVKKGIRELETKIECIDNYGARGNRRTEEKLPTIADHIKAMFDACGQLNPEFRAYFPHGKVTSRNIRHALIQHFNYTDDQLPNGNTIGNIVHRLGLKIGWSQKIRSFRCAAIDCERRQSDGAVLKG